ncbi:MAG: 6-phosphogluconolactonase [Myxococcota bacterium]
MARPPLVAGGAEAFADLAAGTIAGEINRAVRQRGTCALMLAGGSTPAPVYARLSSDDHAALVPWEKVIVYFGDERCVPPDDPASNYAMARRALLDRLAEPPAKVHRMPGEAADRDRAAADYAALLPGRVDVLLLGMGPDGHTASLFPGMGALGEHEKRVVAVQAPRPPRWRLTITPPVIQAARAVIVLVSGAGKAAMVARVLEGGDGAELLPARLARDALWIVDEGAASALNPRGRKYP